MGKNMMNKKNLSFTLVILSVVALLAGMCVIPSTVSVTVEQSSISTLYGNVLYVGGTGPKNYTKIQNAIDNASNGDTVFVFDD